MLCAVLSAISISASKRTSLWDGQSSPCCGHSLCRGPDSAGVALFGSGEMRLRLSVPPDADNQAVIDAFRAEGLTMQARIKAASTMRVFPPTWI